MSFNFIPSQSKSQRRRARRKKLEEINNPTLVNPVAAKASQVQEDPKVQNKDGTIHTEFTSKGLISTLCLKIPIRVARPPSVDQLVQKLSHQQKCIDHVHYVYKKLGCPAPIDYDILEDLQDHSEMYFRKAFISYALRCTYNDILTVSPSVTEKQCLEHCKSLIHYKDRVNGIKPTESAVKTQNAEDMQDSIIENDRDLMIYRKQIIRLALKD